MPIILIVDPRSILIAVGSLLRLRVARILLWGLAGSDKVSIFARAAGRPQLSVREEYATRMMSLTTYVTLCHKFY
jgi:hypothetical protein